MIRLGRFTRYGRDARAAAQARPPEVVEAGPVVLHRVRRGDAAALSAAATASLEHLRPWMPWATPDGVSLVAQAAHCRQAEVQWEAGTDFSYVLRLPDDPDGPVVGGLGLHRRIGPGAVEIGYWTHVDHAGRGYMSAAAQAMTDVAEALPGVNRVEIHTDQANWRSAAIPPKLGYRLERLQDRRPEAPAESGRLQIWVRP
jgi:RimJ/RimL family protein N-acetyltransferase